MITLDPLQIDRRTDRPVRGEVSPSQRDLYRRLALLPTGDRLLMEMVFVDHLPVRRAAVLMGIPAGTASRRARRLWRRLHQPFVATILSHPNELSDEQRRLAVDYFILRRRMTHLAAETGKPVMQVRDAVQFLKGWLRGRMVRRNDEGG